MGTHGFQLSCEEEGSSCVRPAPGTIEREQRRTEAQEVRTSETVKRHQRAGAHDEIARHGWDETTLGVSVVIHPATDSRIGFKLREELATSFKDSLDLVEES